MKIDSKMINEVLNAEINWHSAHIDAPETKDTIKECRAFIRGLRHAQRIIGRLKGVK